MIQKKFIISIIFIILKIDNNIFGQEFSSDVEMVVTDVPSVATDVQLVVTNPIKNTIEDENNNIDSNNNIIPTTIDPKEYHKKIQYNPLLSNGKYYLINLINSFNLCISFALIYMKTIKDRLKTIYYEKNFYVLIEICSLITILILLYDFNKYKKVKNSNDINQYNKYIIDDNNINQLNKQRRYNFINGLSIILSIIHRILSFISIGLNFNITKHWYGLLYKDETKHKILLTINIIGELLIFILSIYYLIVLIKDNTNTVWKSIKNNFKIKDIFPLIGFLNINVLMYIILILIFNYDNFIKDNMSPQKNLYHFQKKDMFLAYFIIFILSLFFPVIMIGIIILDHIVQKKRKSK